MNRIMTLVASVFMVAAISVMAEQVVFTLDLSPSPRTPASSEAITYNPVWGDGSTVTVMLDGEIIGTFPAAGEMVLDTTCWSCGLHTLTHVSGGETLTAQFEKLIPPPPTVSNLSARQRYPWNGLVDIECDIAYGDANADLYVSIVATNTATGEALPVRTVHVADGVGRVVKAGHGTFVWDAGVDAPNVKIDDVALTVDVGPLGGVQLWENGPYWAECNVGANKPEEYGYYFWWGDTVGYRRDGGTWTDGYYYRGVTWVSSTGTRMSSSPFGSSSCPTYEKSNSELQSLGYIDATGNLVAAHDAATAHLGAPWRMPTDAEWGALISNCDTEWTTRNGVSGRLVKGRGAYASKSIFLPAAGFGTYSGLNDTGSYGYYWSSTPDSYYSYYAWNLNFNSGYFSRYGYYDRYYGRSVRPLRVFAGGSGSGASNGGEAGVGTTHLALDTRLEPRTPAASETITYDPAWGDGSNATVTLDGETVGSYSAAGETTLDTTGWAYGLHMLTHTSGDETLTAKFAIGSLEEIVVSNLTARQRYPWNGLVDISCDIMYPDTDRDLYLVLAATNRTTGATIPVRTLYRTDCTMVAPISVRAGHQHLVWNAGADMPDCVCDDVVLTATAGLGGPGLNVRYYDVGSSDPYSTWSSSYSNFTAYFDSQTPTLEGNSTYFGDSMEASASGNGDFRGGTLHGKYANSSADYFATYLTGYFLAETAGDYQFEVYGDDRIVLYVDKSLVTRSQWVATGSGTVNLTTGWHEVALANYEITGGHGFRLRVKRPGDNSLAVVPMALFSTIEAEVAPSQVSVHLPLDTRTSLRKATPSETVVVDPAWYGAASAVVSLDGMELYTVTESDVRMLDTTDWACGLHTLTCAAGDETLAAEFYVPFPPPTVANLSARQRYPWNGLVDIECDIAYGDANADWYVSIVATNTATGEALPVRTVHVADGEGMAVKAGRRHFIWDAGADIAEKVKFDMVALNVTAEVWLGCVQLWENGPYWAECNVGASKPEEYGYYFWWGDMVGYRRDGGTWTDGYYYRGVTWVSSTGTRMSSSPFSSSSYPTYGKSNSELQSLGYIDATGNLVVAHDAATAHLGAPWRMPTDAEWGALISNCDTEWTTRNGVYGRLVKGRGAYASKSIFLPAAGDGIDSDLYYAGSYGYYWSSTPSSDISSDAWTLIFNSGDFDRGSGNRYCGQSVRPLRVFAETSGEITVSCGATTHLALDTRPSPRTPSATETITYNPAWGGGATATVTLDGETVGTYSAAGETTLDTTGWSYGTHTLTHTSGGETLTAEYEKPFPPPVVSNLSAKQRYPWNGLVDIECDIAYGDTDKDLYLTLVATNTATGATIPVRTLYQADGETAMSAVKAGHQHLIWDAGADVPNCAVDDVVLTVTVGLGGPGLNVRYYDVGSSDPYSTWSSSYSNFTAYFDSQTPTLEGNSTYLGDSMEASASGDGNFRGGTLHGKYANSSAEYFATYLTGFFIAETTGDYQFEVLGDDRIVLYVDGSLVCRSQWDSTGSGTVNLVAGMHEVAMANYEITGGHGFRLRVRRPGDGSLAVAPMSSFCTSNKGGQGGCRATHIILDTRLIRTPSASETVAYDPAWGNGETVTLALDGTPIGTYSASGEVTLGTADWADGLHSFTHTSGGKTLHALYLVGTLEGIVVANLTAKQRYPWNGLVDIECDIAYEDADADLEVYIVATNAATGEALPVRTIHVADGDGMGLKVRHRHLIWDAGADIAEKVKFDMVALNVTAEVGLGGVQLWENGPYWAECNVGASKPEEYGYYFWWGDTVGYWRNAGDNGWVSVKDGTSFSFGDSNCPTFDKGNSELQSLGYIDATGNLVAAHDAATAHLGAPWRMPTDAEWGALISNCDTEWTTRNGVYGRLVKGRGAYASKSIFLPAAGYGYDSDLYGTGWDGYYWSSTPDSGTSRCAWELYFGSGSFRRSYYLNRYRGQSVRPLRVFAETSGEITVSCGATTHLALDTREGPRTPAASETITYDPAWGGGSTATVAIDGETVGTFSAAGETTLDTTGWLHGLHTLTHTSGGETLTARFFVQPNVAEALEATGLAWATGGEDCWYGAMDESGVNGDSAKSGAIGDGQETWVEIRVKGAGTIAFRWKVSCENRLDALSFEIDGVTNARFYGEKDWTEASYAVGEVAEHVFRWTYSKSASGSAGEDCAWLDSVVWTPDEAANAVVLSVVSRYDVCEPAVGDTALAWGDEIAAYVPVLYSNGMTRATCTGWTGTGSASAEGSGTNVSFTIEADSSVTWNWDTEYLLELGTTGDGAISRATGWVEEGETVIATATPGLYKRFVRWAGDTDGCRATGAAIRIPMDCGRAIQAVFEPVTCCDVAVFSEHGDPSPTNGVYGVAMGDVFEVSVQDVVENVATQYVCTGWAGTGSAPEAGEGTNVEFQVLEDSSVSWNWQTNYLVSVSVDGAGYADIPQTWVSAGSNLVVTITSEVPLVAVELEGDVDGVVRDGLRLTIPGDRSRSLAVVFHALDIATALDCDGVAWSTDGDAEWFPTTDGTHDGIDAVHSGVFSVQSYSESMLETTIEGDGGEVSFWWKLVPGDATCGVDFYVDGVLNEDIWLFGDTDWCQAAYGLPAGEHTLAWVFWGDGMDPEAAAWLDEVVLPGKPDVPAVTATSTTPDPVPYAWLIANGLASEGASEEAYEDAAWGDAANGVNKVWECYVANMDPTDPDGRFVVGIEIGADGEPVITWSPDWSNADGEDRRVYTVEGRETLDEGDWATPTTADHHFFRVKVALPK